MKKIIIRSLYGMAMSIILILGFSCYRNVNENASSPIETPSPIISDVELIQNLNNLSNLGNNLPEYKVIDIIDSSFGNTKRYSVSVVCEPFDQDILIDIAGNIIQKFSVLRPFNSIYIQFNDRIEYVGKGISLGRVLFAPEGEWSKAMNVQTGNYNTMQYTYELRDKNLDKRPSDEDVLVFGFWNDTYEEVNKSNSSPNEEEVNRRVSKHFGISIDEVLQMYSKVLMWL